MYTHTCNLGPSPTQYKMYYVTDITTQCMVQSTNLWLLQLLLVVFWVQKCFEMFTGQIV